MMHPSPPEDLVAPDHDASDILQELKERLDATRITPTQITITTLPNYPANVLVTVADLADLHAWVEYDGASVWASSAHVITVLDDITWFCILTTTPTTTTA